LYDSTCWPHTEKDKYKEAAEMKFLTLRILIPLCGAMIRNRFLDSINKTKRRKDE
jgi:hypothetical protein